MRVTASLALLALLGASLVYTGQAVAVLPPWGQCGGKSGICGQSDGGACKDAAWDTPCPSGYSCTRQNEWYYQCLPEGGSSSSETSTAAPSTTVQAYGQCGGMSGVCGQSGFGPCEDKVWDSPSCPSGYTCKKDTQWYYQCLPGGSSSSPPSVSSTGGYTPNKGVVPQWGQCGGMSGVCGKSGWGPCQDSTWNTPVCPSGYTCTRQNEYYWQCLPAGTGFPSPSEESGNNQYGPVNGVIPQWGQCGGMSGVCGKPSWGPCVDETWSTPKCPAGFSCKRDTQWYWQCLPLEGSTSAPIQELSGGEVVPVGGTVPQWGQCGGMSGVCGKPGYGPCEDKIWTTPKCPTGFSCKRDTEWYYQCLPENGYSPVQTGSSGSGSSSPATYGYARKLIA